LCAEAIKAAAKVCPFCRAPQTRLARWTPYLGVGFSLLTQVVLIGVVCYSFFPDIFRPAERSFTPYRAQLVVARTSLERDSRKPDFWLSGYVTNIGNYPWRVQVLEVQFLDGASKLADVCDAKISEAFVVQPHQEQAFRVGLGTLEFTNSGIVTVVRVQEATDGNLPPKTD
jgi:hypothetical protein